MKVLQLANKIPFPPLEGGSIAINTITQGLLKAGHEVKVLAMNTPKNFIDIAMLPADYRNSTAIESVYVDNRVKPIDALCNLLFSEKSYHVVRFDTMPFRQKLIELLTSEEYDIVQLEMIYLAPYIETIRKYSKAAIILRAHNVEHLIWKRTEDSTSNFLKKYYLSVLVKRLKAFEQERFSLVDGIAAISEQDAKFIKELGYAGPITDIPVATNIIDSRRSDITPEFPGIFHLGSMNWIPNIEGIKWFIEKVWPLVIAKHRIAKLYLAGRAMPQWLFNLKSESIVVMGEVPDSAAFMQSKCIMVVPLLSGSGMRVKIIEGMAHGKTIVSTSIGAEGIDVLNEKNIMIADTPEAFAAAIGKCISDKALCAQIGENARSLIAEKYNNSAVTHKLIDFYKQILNSKK